MADRAAMKRNIQRIFDETNKTELAPGIVSLIEARGGKVAIREIPTERVLPNPAQPRLSYEEEGLGELAESIREHGVLQPILVRQLGSQFELVAGERRWRASRQAGRTTIPAIISELDERGALEVSIIENLQREDLSPLDEANMYRRMTADLGYSVRALAQKIGKDKGYVENRLRLADAPPEIRELVALRRDTLSHAYELMKIPDQRTRSRLARKVAAGELSLAKLRRKIGADTGTDGGGDVADAADGQAPDAAATGRRVRTVAGDIHDGDGDPDESLMTAKGRLQEAVDEIVDLLRRREVLDELPEVNRDNFARYLTVTKLKLENAIALLRSTGIR